MNQTNEQTTLPGAKMPDGFAEHLLSTLNVWTRRTSLSPKWSNQHELITRLHSYNTVWHPRTWFLCMLHRCWFVFGVAFTVHDNRYWNKVESDFRWVDHSRGFELHQITLSYLKCASRKPLSATCTSVCHSLHCNQSFNSYELKRGRRQRCKP